MATSNLPLNTFRTRAFELTTATQTIYTTPADLTCIILGGQASNFTTSTVSISVRLVKNTIAYNLLKDFDIPPNDAAEITTGKLVVEQGNSIEAEVSADNSIDLVLSLLETSNE